MERAAELADLESAQELVAWDQEAMMPPRGVEGRSHVLSSLAGLVHEKLTAPEVGEHLAALAVSPDGLDEEALAQIRELRRSHDLGTRLPASLVKELARLQSKGSAVWADAKAKNDFDLFSPILGEICRLKREQAEALGYEKEPYDALLDLFEPGAKTEEVAATLGEVKDFLIPFVQRVVDSGIAPDPAILAGPYPHDDQDAFGRELVTALGFDLKAGRLDISNHPFTSGLHAGDTRLTTHYKDELSPSVFGTLHETGHGLYEQFLPDTLRRTPLGQATSLGVHESQSRMWENMVGRSLAFWKHYYPRAQANFPDQLGSVPLETFHLAVNHVEPSLIRIEADEVTYNLHIVLRFEIERELIAGKVRTEELPELWNAKVKEYLGLVPPKPDVGVLQDIHWSAGLIGYFPTYSLGNLYAAQLFEAAARAVPDLENGFTEGKLLPLRDWLVENVHRHGSRYRAPELIERATGSPPTAEAFKRYVKRKFVPLYKL